jgi:hypothetical protein
MTAPSRVMGAALGAALVTVGMTPAALAEEKATETIRLELNGLQPSERGCRVTFVVTNNLGGVVERAAYELAFFDDNGLVSRLAVIDFMELDRGRTKVRQFEFAGMDCSSVGRVLVNDVAECSGAGIDAGDCMSRLDLATRTSIQFGS